MTGLLYGDLVAVLFARADSNYKQMQGVDVWDAERDARNFKGGMPIIAHPPCRAWGVLKHMAKPKPHEKGLALFAVEMVRKWGGVLEHPSGSELWKTMGIPDADMFGDEYGGYTVEIDQYDFGHVANKPTRLYVCGCEMRDLPKMPPKKHGRAAKSMTGQVPGTTRCTQREREYTPPELAVWLVETVRRCKPHNVLDHRLDASNACGQSGGSDGSAYPPSSGD